MIDPGVADGIQQLYLSQRFLDLPVERIIFC